MAKMYFIALVASEEINQQILQWKNFMKEHYGCVVALRSPAHITLIPPFWADESLELRLEESLHEFSRNQNHFTIHLKNLSAFKPRVIYVSVEQNERLLALQHQLQKFIIDKDLFGIKAYDRPFNPHISIATRDLHKKAFHEAWEIFKTKRYEASWTADNISLLKHNEKNWEVIFTSQLSND